MLAAMRKHLPWIRVVGGLLSALMVAGLFPPYNAVGLAWFALAPLLAALWSLEGKRRALRGFGLAWLAGSVSSGAQFSWLAEVSWLGAVLLPIYLGCFWGLFGAYAATLGNPWSQEQPKPEADPHEARRERMLAIAPPKKSGAALASLRAAACAGAVWAGLEWLRGWLFTGFGWNPLGVAFHQTPVVAQFADLLGVLGISLVVVFFQAVLVQTARRLTQSARDGRRRSRWDFVGAAVAVALMLGYGIVTTGIEKKRASVRLKALLVQLNVPQDAAQMHWDDLEIHRAYEDDTLKALENLTQSNEKSLQQAMEHTTDGQVALRWPDWVIWPESAMRGRILKASDGSWGAWQENINTLAAVRTGGPFSLIYGAIELEGIPDTDGNIIPKPDGGMYNCLVAMDPDDHLQTYRKNHLVIFGETIPFMDSLPFLKEIYKQQSGTEYLGSFNSGGSFEPLSLKAADTMVEIIPSVCFEDTVPRLTRKFTRQAPQVIVNITNDGWFRESAAAAQHFANARFRAIELRRPMLRCANTGVSAAIDTTGSTAHPDDPRVPQVLSDPATGHFTRKSQLVELNIPLRPATTLYGLIGDAGIIALAALALIHSLLSRPRRGPSGEDRRSETVARGWKRASHPNNQ